MKKLQSNKSWRKVAIATLSATAIGALLSGCAVGGTTTEAVDQAEGDATLVVWTDAIRLPLFEAYQEAHPEVTLEIETLDSSPDELASKILLANTSGQGWPDVLATAASAASSLAGDPYDFALDLTSLVDPEIVGDFSQGTLDPCTVGDELICLRGDFAPGVLWYNPNLMKEFGYSVPTTWEEFQATGEKLAEEHPGYVVGSASNPWDDLTYYSAAECPGPEFTGVDTVTVDLNDPNCTRVTEMIDSMLEVDAFARTAVVDPQFAQDYGTPEKVLMMMGPIWYGQNVYANSFDAAPGTLSFAAPPKWEADAEAHTGDIGGRAYVVSSHSEYQQAAADLVTWVTTGPFLATEASTTLPSYEPMQGAWLDRNIEDGTFTAVDTPLDEVLATAVDGIWTGLTYKQANSETYRSVVSAALGTGKSMTETVPEWETRLVQNLEAAGWEVE
ncbi:ABC transporter substrate-binding protein [Microbacterium sp. AK031]|uniref:ABC transporter substrate-binding protein n=1 Tax=Microbacterium sp. AK031 TaxID=2723076 RepID=UPI002166EA13|nr:ABC transporter substrate-binding protein [Microbacterium sp. AK031]MCS3843824.1 multiple sugar transport system substrate-binding protein [Microbacterium sp. AK031]